MFWLPFITSKSQRLKVVEPDRTPFTCQENVPPPSYENKRNPHPLSIDANPNPFLERTPRTPPIQGNAQVINPHRRCHSVDLAHLDPGPKVIDVLPPHKRSHSHGGPIRLESKKRFGDGPHYIERRQRFVESTNPHPQIEFVHIRKPSRSRSRPARQLEWVQKRQSSSPSYARSRSRGRPVVRDRIIEVVEEKERSLSPAAVPLVENEDRNRVHPFEHEVEDYYEYANRGRAYQEIIINKPYQDKSPRKARSRSYTRRRPPSTATSSIRSTESMSRQSIHSLERSVSSSVSASPKNGTLDSEAESVSTTTTTVSRPTSFSSPADLEPPTALSKVKFRYTPMPDKETALRSYNRVKVFRGPGQKNHRGSNEEENTKDERDEDKDEELKRLRRLLKVSEQK